MQESRKNNSLNTIRLITAIQVMLGHLIEHLRVPDVQLGGSIGLQKIVFYFLNYFYGVPVFFFLSGFLIYKSVENSESWKEYSLKRILRIYPELWIAVLFEITSIIILYFHQIDWSMLLLFTGTQSTFFQFWTPDFLRGYGCGTPNGSLWTIVVFVQFYILIWFFRTPMKKVSLPIWIISELLLIMLAFSTNIIASKIPELITKLIFVSIIPYLWIFCLGMIISKYWNQVKKMIIKYWFFPIVLYIFYLFFIHRLDFTIGKYPLLHTMISVFGCLGLAYRFPKINVNTDISYEMYIFHMIIVNILITLGVMEIRGLYISIILTILCSIIVNKLYMKFYKNVRAKI